MVAKYQNQIFIGLLWLQWWRLKVQVQSREWRFMCDKQRSRETSAHKRIYKRKIRIKTSKYLSFLFTQKKQGHSDEARQKCSDTTAFPRPFFRLQNKGKAEYYTSSEQPHRQGLGRSFWAMPSSLPAHFCPAAKKWDGATGGRKKERKKERSVLCLLNK